MKTPDVKIVVVRDSLCGRGAKLFIDGKEFDCLTDLKFSGHVSTDGLRTSKLEITFIGDILVEQRNG